MAHVFDQFLDMVKMFDCDEDKRDLQRLATRLLRQEFAKVGVKPPRPRNRPIEDLAERLNRWNDVFFDLNIIHRNDLTNEEVVALREGRKLDAVKSFRNRIGPSLMVSKHFVEEWERRYLV